MVTDRIESIAQALYQARRDVKPAPLPRKKFKDFSLQEAYAVQARLVEWMGGSVLGYKIGFGKLTSDRKEIGFGRLLSTMRYHSEIDRARFVSLHSENEIALIMAVDVQVPIDDLAEFTTTIAGVAPAIEMPDKNFQGFEDMTGYDLFANDAIAGAFTVGESMPVSACNFESLAVKTLRNGEVVDVGGYANIPQHPLKSAHWLSQELIRQGAYLKKGDVILTGSMGAAIPAQAGTYRSEFVGLPTLQFRVV